MRITKKSTLKLFWEKNAYKDSEKPLKAWHDEVKKAEWENYNELKTDFPDASIVGNDRVVFNIKGNQYRLIVKIDFKFKRIFIRFIGTHKQYNKVNAKEV